mgnify:CR=1 FL=1
MNNMISLSKLFDKRIFRIPDYQRGYAWQTPQLVDFWDDLINLAEDRYHYTGMLSLKKLKRSDYENWAEEKWLINQDDYEAYHIVDGQQRLTTFIILVNSIINKAEKEGIEYLNNNSVADIIDTAINGIEKEDNTNYYSVIKNADYTIIVDNFIDTNDGWSWAAAGDFFMNSAYRQGYIITQFEKVYDDKSGLDDEVFYNTNYSQVNDNVPVTFDKNCTVKAVKEPYLNVGGIYTVVEKGKPLESYEDVPLTWDGTVEEIEGVYYILLKDEVCIHQDAYKTNLEITDYKYEIEKNGRGGNSIKAQFTAKPLNIAENEELWLYQVCRTYRGIHFVYPLVYVGTTGFGMPVREHELKLNFES